MQISFSEYRDGKWFDLIGAGKKAFDRSNDVAKIEITAISDVERLIKEGLQKRKTRNTNQNSFSSRSHAILTIHTLTHGSKLIFVDMAGNESADGKENVDETSFINKSISQLNTVLAFKKKGVPPPYRDNPFTTFLQPYVQKNTTILYYFIKKNNTSKDFLAIQDLIVFDKKK